MCLHLHTYILVLACTALVQSAGAVVPAPPPAESSRDSAAVGWEEGAELTRWLGTARFDFIAPMRTRTYFNTDWITGLSRGQTTEGRLRHDVRWNVSAQRNFNACYGLWGAASGQHYVDRPREDALAFAQENRSHLVRAGVGPSMRWNRLVKTTHSVGLVADSRVNQTDAGFGSWNHGDFKLFASPQSTHEAVARFEYEAPGDRVGSDIGLNYNLRQDYGVASNQADLVLGWTRREVLTAAENPSQLREERTLRFSDGLDYELAQGAVLRGTGDMRYLDTRLNDQRGSSSRLEELESGIKAELALSHKQHTGILSVGLRNATQTVRGEILSGQKTELALRGQTAVQQTALRARAAFSKYTLDTRSDQNFDDRDELTWRLEAGASRRLNSALAIDVQALADLNHLVYIYSRNSANNRWTRLLLLTTRFVHRPNQNVLHIPEFRISANYQAYDFELNPRQVRSTVFRRVAIGDSITFQVQDRWTFVLRGEVSREELGRLFWEQFEEERSDQTDVVSSSCMIMRTLSKTSNIGFGVAYGHRMSDRFEAEGDPRRVLDIESWGPITKLSWLSQAWFVNTTGQFVMQSELIRNDRDYLSGSLTAGRTW